MSRPDRWARSSNTRPRPPPSSRRPCSTCVAAGAPSASPAERKRRKMSAPPDFELPPVEMPFEVQPLDPPPPSPEELRAELARQRKEEDENSAELASGIVT